MTNLKQATELATVTTQELKTMLAKSIELTAKHLNYLAEIWAELNSRGEDLSDLRGGILAYLPMIANDSVDSRIVVNYAGQKTLLSALSRLPKAEQSRLADSGYVTVVNMDDAGKKAELQIPLSRLSSKEVYQVFGDSYIRSTDEQIKLLDIQSVRKPTVKPIRKSRRVRVENGMLIVASAAADMDRVIDQLSAHYGVDIQQFLKNNGKK